MKKILKSKHRLLAFVLAVALALSFVPTLGITTAADIDLSGSTIVLYNGKAYQDTQTGTDITNQLVGMGLSYDGQKSEWTMDGFVFSTTAATGLQLDDENTTIIVSGTNTISVDNDVTKNSDGIVFGGEDGGSVTIKGAATGTNTLEVTVASSEVTNSEIGAIDVGVDTSLTIGDNVTVTATSGSGDCSSTAVSCGPLSVLGTGKLIALSDELGIYSETEPNVTAVSYENGTELVWNYWTYKNGDDDAKNVTMTVATGSPAADYTIVLSDGKAYKNTKTGADITADVAAMGLSYDSGKGEWTMNNFVFTTTAKAAVHFKGQNVVVVVSGSNSLTVNPGAQESSVAGLEFGGEDATVTIKGATSGTNTLTVKTSDLSHATGENWAIDAEDGALTIGDNVTVTSIAGHGASASYGLLAVSLTVTGTGKLIVQADEESDGTGIILADEADATVANTAGGAAPTWVEDQGSYMNGSEYAKNITLTAAASSAADYTIVLSGDKAYKNSEDGDDITADVAAMGLTYAEGVWTMNDFNFTTTAAKAFELTGLSSFTVTVTGDNTITGGTSSDTTTRGLKIENETKFQGTGTLTVTSGAATGFRNSRGVNSEANVEIEGITFTINAGAASDGSSEALSLASEGGTTFTVNNATVVCNAGDASYSSSGIYNDGFAIVVTGTGTLTAKAGVGEDGSFAVSGGSDPQLTVVDGDGNALTWDSNDETYKNADNEVAATAVLTAAGSSTTAITVTAGSATKKYDGTPLTKDAASVTVGTLKPGDTLSATVTGTITDAGTADNVISSCKVMRGTEDVTAEYEITTANGKLTVNKVDITLTSASDTKNYDGTPLTNSNVSVTGDGFAAGEGFTYNVTGSQTAAGSSANTFTYTAADGTKLNNYNVTKVEGTLTVEGRTEPLTITVEDQAKLYDGTASINTSAYTVSGDLAAGDTITVTLSNSNINAGTYADGIAASYKIMRGDTDVTDMYYNVTVDCGDLTVNKRDVTLTSASDTKNYDGTPLTNSNVSVTGDGFAAGESFTYNVTGSQTVAGSSANTFTCSPAAGTNPNNYNITKVEGSLTVGQVYDIIVESCDNGSASVNPTSAGAQSTVVITATPDAGYELDKIEVFKLGDYDTKVSVTGNTFTMPAYEVTVSVSFKEISQQKTAITVTAGSATKTYDGTPLTMDAASVSSGTLKPGDELVATAAGSITDAGTADNVISSCKVMRGTEDVTAEYEITTANGTLTVNKVDITLTSASDTKNYDGTPLTNSNVSVTGDGFAADESFTYNVTGSQTVAGSSANTFTYTAADGTKLTNYNVTKVEGTLTVDGRTEPLTITVEDQTKLYDGTASINTYAYTVSGDLAAGDTITVTLSNSNVNAGTYADGIAASYKIMNGDTDVTDTYYNVTVDCGDLTVNKRDVTFTSASDTKNYDGTPLTNSNVSVTGDGFVSGESFTYNVTGSQTAAGSSANTFTCSPAAGTNPNNYSITKVEGTLTVNAPLSIDPAPSENGTVTVSGIIEAGQTITVTATPDAGYELDTITVFGTENSMATVVLFGNTFTMPSYAVTVNATFKPVGKTITTAAVENGTVSVCEKASVGEGVVVTVTPDCGYVLDSFKVYRTGDGTKTNIAEIKGTNFVMPDYDVTVEVTFKETIAATEKKTVNYNKDGTVASTVITTYDSNGNVIKIVSYKADGTIGYITNQEYDEKGNKTTYETYNMYAGELKQANLTEFTYSATGKTTVKTETLNTYDKTTGELTKTKTTVITYEYNSDDKLCEETRKIDGKWNYTYYYTYNGNAQIKERRAGEFDNARELSAYKLFDENGNTVLSGSVYGQTSLTTSEMKYNVNGDIENESFAVRAVGTFEYLEQNGSFSSYTYDKYGNLVSKISSNYQDSAWQPAAITTYTYDENGNVLSYYYEKADGTPKQRIEYTYYADGLLCETKTYDYDSELSRLYLASVAKECRYGTITAETTGNGAVTVSDAVEVDSTVTLIITPSDGYEVDEIKVTKTGEPDITVPVTGNTFTMPDYDITVTVTFAVLDNPPTADSIALPLTVGAMFFFAVVCCAAYTLRKKEQN